MCFSYSVCLFFNDSLSETKNVEIIWTTSSHSFENFYKNDSLILPLYHETVVKSLYQGWCVTVSLPGSSVWSFSITICQSSAHIKYHTQSILCFWLHVWILFTGKSVGRAQDVVMWDCGLKIHCVGKRSVQRIYEIHILTPTEGNERSTQFLTPTKLSTSFRFNKWRSFSDLGRFHFQIKEWQDENIDTLAYLHPDENAWAL